MPVAVSALAGIAADHCEQLCIDGWRWRRFEYLPGTMAVENVDLGYRSDPSTIGMRIVPKMEAILHRLRIIGL